MNVTLRSSRWFFAAAMIALGITGIVNGDFALVWQHVPAHVPGRTILAYACAVIEIALGIGLLFKRSLTPTCRVLFPYMVLWLLLVEIQNVIPAPLDAGAWGSGGGIAIITAGAWCLFALHAGTRHFGFATGSSGIRAARWLLIIALPMIGVEVIVDSVKAGDKVMQPWLQVLPDPMACACFTGICSIATALAFLFGVWPRLAATPAFIISFLIAAGVWLVADTYCDAPWFAAGRPVWKT